MIKDILQTKKKPIDEMSFLRKIDNHHLSININYITFMESQHYIYL